VVFGIVGGAIKQVFGIFGAVFGLVGVLWEQFLIWWYYHRRLFFFLWGYFS
jgi:hypothetical protein